MSQNENSAFAIESNSIDYVDPSQRHGKVRDLFTLWFCTNIAPLFKTYSNLLNVGLMFNSYFTIKNLKHLL